MTIESDVRTRLVSNGTISTLASTRVYPVILPQDPTLPALTYSKVSDQGLHNLTGVAGRSMPRMSIHSWGYDYATAKALSKAVRNAMDGFIGRLGDGNSPESFRNAVIKFDNEIDDYEEDTGFYRVIQDYMLNHAE